MRLESIKIHNVGPFRDFAVDFTAHPGPLVAVVGPNGAGKSTLLELAIPGACYRATPTRGSLIELATARDSSVESRLVNGHAWTLRHLLDKVSGKSEAFVLDGAGVSVLPDSKVRSMDAWAAAHLPAPEVLYACMFAPQGAGGFLAAKPGERKATLLRVLGVERLEALAERAREHERAAKAALATLEARLTDERTRVGNAAALLEESGAAAERSGRADAALEHARDALARTEAEDRKLVEQSKAVSDRAKERAAIEGRISAATLRIEDLERRIANNRAVLADAKQIRAAVATVERLRAEIAHADAEAGKAKFSYEQAVERARSTDARLAALASRIERATEALQGRDAVRLARESLPTLEAESTRLAQEHHEAEDALERLQGERAVGADERIKSLRAGHARNVAEPAGAAAVSAATLSEDDGRTAAAAALPGRVKDAQLAARAAFARSDAASKKLAAAKAVAARAELLERAAADLEEAKREHATLEEDHRAAAKAADELDLKETQQREFAQARRAELEVVQKLAAKAEPLAHAEARLAELEPQLDAAAIERSDEEQALARTPELPEVRIAVDVAGARRAVVEAEAAAKEAARALAVAEQRLAAATEGAARVAELERDRDAAAAELADWSRLALDLGRDGLQAAEIDAAGPDLTELVNDLLHTCHGPRFTVRVETQRASADGKRLLEGCDVVVLDTVGGREAPGETFSGGERVIIGEALSLALSMLACRRAGLEGVTLVRDESGAALDPANARTYVAMLRRAAELVRADKVLFVSHSPEVVEMADSRIEVG